MSRLIMERGIPFSMKLASEEVNPGVSAMLKWQSVPGIFLSFHLRES